MDTDSSVQQADKRGQGSKIKRLKFGKSFWRNPRALAFIIVFAAIGGFFIFKSFAATPDPNGTYTWSSNADYNASSATIGSYQPTFTNTATAPLDNLNSDGAVGLAITAPATTNMALNHRAFASDSASTTQNLPAAAFDGNPSTYWQSSNPNSAWIAVDMGSIVQTRTIVINWGKNYPTNFQIGTATTNDSNNYFYKVYQTVTNTGGTTTITLKGGGYGQFLQIYAFTPAGTNVGGYQINDIGVYGAPTYRPTGTYSVVYNATSKVQWTGLSPNITLNGGSATSNICTADSAAAAATGPWTSCTTDLNSVGTALVQSQYIKITLTFNTPIATNSPFLNSLSLLWFAITPQAPTVSLSTPTNGSTVNGTINLTANPGTNRGIAGVDFYNGSTYLGSADTAPFTYAWNTTSVPDGTYNLTAQITDGYGNLGTSTPVSVTVRNTVATGWWKPTSAQSITWHWQLQGVPSPSLNKQVYDIDGFNSTAADVASYHATGAKVICYMDLGTSEDFRSDFNSFPAAALGSTNGWPGERWLDIRAASIKPIMIARMQMCVQKGFDALEPDNIDGYANSSGFPLTAQNQLDYNNWIATTAHSLGLSVGLKNDLDQVPQLLSSFDWALNEQCNEYGECSTLAPFVSANKAVFNAEYGSNTNFCAADVAAHINGVRFDLNLTGAVYQPCGGWGGGAAAAAAAAPSSKRSTRSR